MTRGVYGRFEWSVASPEGEQVDGVYSIGPSGPRQVIADGGHLQQVEDNDGNEVYLPDGSPMMEMRTPIAPDSVVVRHLIVTFPWEEIAPEQDAELWPSGPFPINIRHGFVHLHSGAIECGMAYRVDEPDHPSDKGGWHYGKCSREMNHDGDCGVGDLTAF